MSYNKLYNQKKRTLKPIPPPPTPPFKIIPPPPPTPQFKIIPPPPPTPPFKIIPPPPPTPPPPYCYISKDDWDNIDKRYVWVTEKWYSLKKDYQLDNWILHFNSRLKTTAGQCLYGKNKRIELATLLIDSPNIKKADILDTLLHEVAHAIAGYKAAHGPVWKKIAHELGCSGDVCHSLSF